MEYSGTGRSRHSVRESFLEREEEGGSEEVRTSSHHQGAAPTTEVGNIGAAPLPSTSSTAVAQTSDCSKDKQSTECPECPICLAEFTTQDVGTTDTCDHVFCAGCIEEWSNYVTTCPVDRQAFSFILVRHHPDGEIIRMIPVESRRQELSFCGVCGECDHEDRMLLCHACSFACHLTCLMDPPDSVTEEGWICPYCTYLVLFIATVEIMLEIQTNHDDLPHS
jgi:PHD and RING finger domain-containing protein 1